MSANAGSRAPAKALVPIPVHRQQKGRKKLDSRRDLLSYAGSAQEVPLRHIVFCAAALSTALLAACTNKGADTDTDIDVDTFADPDTDTDTEADTERPLPANQLDNGGFETTSTGADPPFNPPVSWSPFGAAIPFRAVDYTEYATQAHGDPIINPNAPSDTSNPFPGLDDSRALKTWGVRLGGIDGRFDPSLGTLYQEFGDSTAPTGSSLTLTGWAYVSSVDPLDPNQNAYLVIKCFPDDFSAEYCGGGSGMRSALITNELDQDGWVRFATKVDNLDSRTTVVQAGVEFEQCPDGACEAEGAVYWDNLFFSWEDGPARDAFGCAVDESEAQGNDAIATAPLMGVDDAVEGEICDHGTRPDVDHYTVDVEPECTLTVQLRNQVADGIVELAIYQRSPKKLLARSPAGPPVRLDLARGHAGELVIEVTASRGNEVPYRLETSVDCGTNLFDNGDMDDIAATGSWSQGEPTEWSHSTYRVDNDTFEPFSTFYSERDESPIASTTDPAPFPGLDDSAAVKMFSMVFNDTGLPGHFEHTIASLYQSFPIGVTGGGEVTLTGWAYIASQGAPLSQDNQSHLFIRCFNQSSEEVCSTDGLALRSTPITMTTPVDRWTRVELTVPSLPADTVFIDAGVQFETCSDGPCTQFGGAVYWDELALIVDN